MYVHLSSVVYRFQRGMVDVATKKVLASIPLLSVNAGPRDSTWNDRLREELTALISVS